jgi:hypothetical protein
MSSVVSSLLNKLDQFILNPLIALVFAVAFLLFFIGIVQLVAASQAGKETGDAKQKVLYGLVGMFVMFSAYGLVHLIINTFGIPSPSFISL